MSEETIDEVPEIPEVPKRPRKTLIAILLIAIVGVACMHAIVGGSIWWFFIASLRPEEGDTVFYVLGRGGEPWGYPNYLMLGEQGKVILGVVNYEYEAVEYKIIIKLDNETIKTIRGIWLKHEERWEKNVTFTPSKVGENLKLDFFLHRTYRVTKLIRQGVKGINPYRMVFLWITVNEPKV